MHNQVADRALRWDGTDECGTTVAWAARPSSLQDIADLAAKFTGASGAALALEKPSGEIVCAARSGEAAPAVGAVLNRSLGISAFCVRRSVVQRCADTEADPRVDAEVCRQLGIRSIVVLPLRRNGRVAGLLSVYSRSASKFDHQDVAGLKYLQSVAAGLADADEATAQLAPELIAAWRPREEPRIDPPEPETAPPPEIEATVRDYPQPAKAGADLASPLGDSVAPASEPDCRGNERTAAAAEVRGTVAELAHCLGNTCDRSACVGRAADHENAQQRFPRATTSAGGDERNAAEHAVSSVRKFAGGAAAAQGCGKPGCRGNGAGRGNRRGACAIDPVVLWARAICASRLGSITTCNSPLLGSTGRNESISICATHASRPECVPKKSPLPDRHCAAFEVRNTRRTWSV